MSLSSSRLTDEQQQELLTLCHARSGHFRFESGHHGDWWLDLELLFTNPGRVRPFADRLAESLRPYAVDGVCGPLVEGAFVALQVAEKLGVPFSYANPYVSDEDEAGLFPVRYLVPSAQRAHLSGRRVAIVNDVINAGSAVRGAYDDLQQCGADVVCVASLLALGKSPQQLADSWGIDLVSLRTQASNLWTPVECPLCARGVAIDS